MDINYTCSKILVTFILGCGHAENWYTTGYTIQRYLQAVEHLRQHAGHHGEVRRQLGGHRRRANEATDAGEEEDGSASTAHAPQVGSGQSLSVTLFSNLQTYTALK